MPDIPKVMLINPPQTYPSELEGEFQTYIPIGLASLAAAVQNCNFTCEILDCLLDTNTTTTQTTVRFGSTDETIIKTIKASKPTLIGITNPFSMFIEDALHVARLAKAVRPETPVILGGIEASIRPNAQLLLQQHQEIDICVVGEGEATLAHLTKVLAHSSFADDDLRTVNGIIYRSSQGKVIETSPRKFIADLDKLPLPAYDLLNLDAIYDHPKYALWRLRQDNVRCAPIHTSRGCPYKCNFCSVHSQVGYKYRSNSVHYVLSHHSTRHIC
ncbi:B12-binding domain-containing radical SAM protein [Polycladidibacter stylochi]|uniref:B12-binding domain-containing radical SAM protein n=1 Tax=Polycladidibacter stylochi TaxID=1807766 RepID=UPI00082BEA43|nr:cobalamin-dependent protein [Pseudovibrio stylochi]